MSLMVKQKLTSSYVNCKTNITIELKEQIHDYIVTKPTMNEKRLIFSRALSLHNCVYYLTEVVFREIMEAMRSESLAISSQLHLKCKINEYLQDVKD